LPHFLPLWLRQRNTQQELESFAEAEQMFEAEPLAILPVFYFLSMTILSYCLLSRPAISGESCPDIRFYSAKVPVNSGAAPQSA
jgi:hypothetical protein